MAFCTECGITLDNEDTFCMECGTRIEKSVATAQPKPAAKHTVAQCVIAKNTPRYGIQIE